jgi:hypothetical protein
MLVRAPDKRRFFGDLRRLHPQSWSGWLGPILIHRKAQIMALAKHEDDQLHSLIAEILPDLERWIENQCKHERELERAREESFE